MWSTQRAYRFNYSSVTLADSQKAIIEHACGDMIGQIMAAFRDNYAIWREYGYWQ